MAESEGTICGICGVLIAGGGLDFVGHREHSAEEIDLTASLVDMAAGPLRAIAFLYLYNVAPL